MKKIFAVLILVLFAIGFLMFKIMLDQREIIGQARLVVSQNVGYEKRNDHCTGEGKPCYLAAAGTMVFISMRFWELRTTASVSCTEIG